MKKVLLACPTSDVKLYCQDKWIKHINKLTYQNLDILIIDNSKTKDNSEILKSYNIPNLKVMWVGKEFDFEKINIREIMTFCTNIILQYSLNKGYDYWFSLESDVFPPLNIIEHLIASNFHVCGLPYFHAGGEEPPRLINHTLNKCNIAMPKTSSETFHEVTGDYIRVYQSGIGCMLFDRISLIKIGKLKYRDTLGGEFPDAFMLDKLFIDNKYLPYIDTRFYAYHFNSDIKWNELRNKENL